VIGGALGLAIASSSISGVDLPSLAKETTPAVVSLSVIDAGGTESATATGFFISGDGILVTNWHVIENADSVVAHSTTGTKFTFAGVLLHDEIHDLAVLKANEKSAKWLTLGDSTKLEVGSRIAVIGSPHGLDATLSDGIISAKRHFPYGNDLLQITAPVSPGSSGSPVLNERGEAVGIVRLLLRDSQNLNFAICAEVLKEVLALRRGPAAPISFREAAEQGKQINKANARDLAAEGESHRKNKELDAGIESYTEALTLDPSNAEYWIRIGELYGLCDRFDRALECLTKAVGLNPSTWEGWRNLGLVYFHERRWAEADRSLQLAIHLGSSEKQTMEQAMAWTDLGVVYQTCCGDNTRASSCFERAVNLSPSYALAWRNLCTTSCASGKKNRAAAALKKLTELHSSFAKEAADTYAADFGTK
jgi:Tfp pilus assembly protein PilF